MEAATVVRPVSRARAVADLVWANVLWVTMGVLIVYLLIKHPTSTLIDIKDGLSNGTIWALIALGYTLVYGIIELINFAHGEVFMIGSFVATSIWQAAHLHDNPPAGTAIVWILLVL